MLKQEIYYLLTAIMFFTRIPIPVKIPYSEHYLNKSRKYFPLTGWMVGIITASILWLTSQLLPIYVSVIFAVAIGIWVTGAFHEDGFADMCDAFGGGWSKEQILTIMKDSRVGAYGSVGLILLLMLKIAAIAALASIDIWLSIWIIINAQTMSRFIASTFVQTHAYVQDIDKSKSKPIANKKFSTVEMLYSLVLAFIPLLLIENFYYWLAIPIAFLPKFYMGYMFRKRIGGYTGDCLGAVQQVSEIFFYMAVLGIWKFL